MFQDIDAQLDGTTISLDLIKCNDYYCANMINIGFDCAVAKEAERIKKRKFISPGLSYILGVVVVLFRKFGTKMKLIFDDGVVMEKEFTLTAIGNGKFCGGGFKTAPLASLTDGIFDICAIKKVSRPQFITLVSSYKKGTFLEKKSAQKLFIYRREKHFKMEFNDLRPICIDGEIFHAESIDFSIAPGSFNFVIPKGSKLRFPDAKA
jgi:diacylglycerol kinase family enzyme